MELQDILREAIVTELQRQSEAGSGALKVELEGPAKVRLQGPVNLDELIMVITGSVAGGP